MVYVTEIGYETGLKTVSKMESKTGTEYGMKYVTVIVCETELRLGTEYETGSKMGIGCEMESRTETECETALNWAWMILSRKESNWPCTRKTTRTLSGSGRRWCRKSK